MLPQLLMLIDLISGLLTCYKIQVAKTLYHFKNNN